MSQIDLHPDDLLDRERRGTLSSAERQRLDAHLARCSACRFERRITDDLEQESAPRSEDREMLARLVDMAAGRAIAAEPDARPPPRSRRRSRAAVALILLAAAAAAAVIASSIGDEDGRSPPPPPSTANPAPEKTDPAPAQADSASAAPPVQAPTSVAPTSSAVGPDGRADQKPAASASIEAAEPTAAELFSLANQARRAGNAAEAARLYRELQKRFPASRETAASRLALARLLLDKLGDPAAALALFDGYLASSGGTLAEEAHLGRALALMRLGRTSEERAAWELILRRYPSSVHAERARERLEKLR